jgi:hypothetical protein
LDCPGGKVKFYDKDQLMGELGPIKSRGHDVVVPDVSKRAKLRVSDDKRTSYHFRRGVSEKKHGLLWDDERYLTRHLPL